MAWLAGVAAWEMLKLASLSLTKQRGKLTTLAVLKAIAVFGLLAAGLARSLGRLEAGIEDMQDRPKAASNPIITRMKELAPETNWVYADDPTYPFHAQIPMLPELAVVTPKRIWSGQITEANVVEICRQRQVEQLVLRTATSLDGAWTNMLAREYVAVAHDTYFKLYVAKNLLKQQSGAHSQ